MFGFSIDTILNLSQNQRLVITLKRLQIITKSPPNCGTGQDAISLSLKSDSLEVASAIVQPQTTNISMVC